MIHNDLSGRNGDFSDEEIERIMQAFDPHLKEPQECLHPELRPLVEKIKTVTGILKKHANQADWDHPDALVKYADWCFYPESSGDIKTLAIYADLSPARSDSRKEAQTEIIRETEAALHPLHYTLHHKNNSLTILIPILPSPGSPA